MIDIRTVDDAAVAAVVAADLVTAAIDDAVRGRGRAAVGFSGGTSPHALFAELATRPIDWDGVHLFQVDERVAPEGHPDRNASGLTAHLVQPAGIAAEHVHLMPVTDGDLDGAAAEYGALLHEVCDGVLDLVHLGMGPDGHTASWPPGDPVAGVAHRDVTVVGPFGGRLRMTLTPAAVNRARRIVWVVTGADKAPMVRRLLDGDPSIPASRVRADDGVVLVVDRAAAP